MTAGDMEQEAFVHDFNKDFQMPSLEEVAKTAEEAGLPKSAAYATGAAPVVEETGDSEESIPTTVVAEPEIEMPPTPTPTPTPNLEEIARQKAAAEAKVAQIDNCMAFLEENQIRCSGATPAEAAAMANDVAKEEVGTENPEPVNPVIADPTKVKGSPITQQDLIYDPKDLQGNFQALVLHCTGKAKAKFEDAEYATTELRIDLSSKLSRYASAMLCLDSNFPDCIPDKAKAIIEYPPHIDGEGKTRDEWPCW